MVNLIIIFNVKNLDTAYSIIIHLFILKQF